MRHTIRQPHFGEPMAKRIAETVTAVATVDPKLAQLESLQSEYAELKSKCESASRIKAFDNVSLARKGDVTREIHALKRELGID